MKNLDIQVLRGFAVIFVLMQHLSLTATLGSNLSKNFYLPFYLGVELFFIISGYVVTLSLLKSSSRFSSACTFILRRAFRLYPPLILFLMIAFTASVITDYVSGGTSPIFYFSFDEFFRQSLAVMGGVFINVDKDNHLYAYGAMWSLSVEFQFYLVYACLWLIISLPCLRNRRGNILQIVSFIIALLSITMRIYIYITDRAIDLAFVHYFLTYKFDLMAFGCFLATISPNANIKSLFSSLGARFITRAKYSLFFTSLLLVGPLCLGSHIPTPLHGAEKYGLREGILMIFTMITYGSLIYFSAFTEIFGNKESKIYKIIYTIGELSYDIYLIHFPIMMLVWCAVYPLHINNHYLYGILQAILTIPITIIISRYIYKYIEKPSISFGRIFIQKLENSFD